MIAKWNYSSVRFQLGPIYRSFYQSSCCKAVRFAQHMKYLSSLQQNGSLKCKHRWGNSAALFLLRSNSTNSLTCPNFHFPNQATLPTHPPTYQLSNLVTMATPYSDVWCGSKTERPLNNSNLNWASTWEMCCRATASLHTNEMFCNKQSYKLTDP